MATPDKTPKPIPDMPGFSRDAEGKMIFDPFETKNKPEPIPLPEVTAWEIWYYKPTVIYGFSPSDTDAIEKFINIASSVEFVFCTTAKSAIHSMNITYRCIPHSHTCYLTEVEVFDLENKKLIHTFPDKNLDEIDSRALDEALVRHLAPLATFLGNRS